MGTPWLYPTPDLFKIVHLGKRSVGIRLIDLLFGHQATLTMYTDSESIQEKRALLFCFAFGCNLLTTSMHSSRMRTARLMTVSKHALHRGRGCIPACTSGGCLPGDVCPGGCLPRRGDRPPCEQNDWHTGVKILPCRNFVKMSDSGLCLLLG